MRYLLFLIFLSPVVYAQKKSNLPQKAIDLVFLGEGKNQDLMRR